jgi:CheY-like chemotaxis protein
MATILIVDDSKTIQKQVSMFSQTNYPDIKVVTASSGEEALELIPHIKEDIVAAIFDYNMDGMTGLELIEKVKPFISMDKIILCTANIQETIQTKAMNSGVRFQEKPLTNDIFKEIISKIIQS